MLDIVYETLAVCETAQQKGLPAVWTLGFALLDPGSEAALAG